jgi:Uma2 family endonuclease
MTTRTKPTLDFSTFPESDGEPVAENTANLLQMMDLIFSVQSLFASQGRTRYVVGGNQFLYYNEHNGRDHVAPDVYVGFDLPRRRRPSWKTWIEGKSPDIVWEITSESTQREDLGHKRELYERLGVQEYYIHDPEGELQPLFRGYALRAGRFEPLEALPTGGIMSPLLGTELRPLMMPETAHHPAAAIYLRVIDPATGEFIPLSDEVRQEYEEMSRGYEEVSREYHVARERIVREEGARLAAERHAAHEEEGRLAAEDRAAHEEGARLAAEDRAARAEAALQEALAALARQQAD